MKQTIRQLLYRLGLAALSLLFLLILSLFIAQEVLAQSEAALLFLEEELSLSPDEENMVKGHFTLQNNGPALAISNFELILVDENNVPTSTVPSMTVSLLDGANRLPCQGDPPCKIGAYEMAQFEIALPDGAPEKALSGYLEIDAKEQVGSKDVSSEALKITVKTEDDPAKFLFFIPADKVDTEAVMAAGLAAAVITFIAAFAWLLRAYKGNDWQKIISGHLGVIAWDFSKNWLANVTGLSAITLAVIALTIIPETTQFLTKGEKINEFAALHAIFGLGVVVAPLVGAMLTTIFPHKDKPDASRVWIFVLAVSIIIWAATGELLTAAIFFDEIRVGNKLNSTASIIIEIILLLIILMAVVYTIKKTVKSSLGIINGQDQEEAVLAAKTTISEAIKQLKNDSPAAIGAGLDFDGHKRSFESLQDTGGTISAWKTLERLPARIKTCTNNDTGKKEARLIMRAVYQGLDGILTAMRPKDDGKPQPPSALPNAVTKLCQLYEAAADVPAGSRLVMTSAEANEEVEKLAELLKDLEINLIQPAFALPKGISDIFGFDAPAKEAYIPPTPKVYLP